MLLSDVCQLRISGPKSRTERPRKTIIGTEIANIIRDLDTTFKVKRSRSPGRFTQRGLNARGGCSGQRGKVLLCCVCSAAHEALWRPRGRRGTYCVATCTACSRDNERLIRVPTDLPKNLWKCWRKIFHRPDILPIIQPTVSNHWRNNTAKWLAVWCSGNALVSINAVALHRARLVLGWVTAFGQVNCLIT